MKSTLKFMTAGSVDDGKSTLIGRLLYDSKALFSDQISTLHNHSEGKLDLASLTDGLLAEREQGITIDIAYRFFSNKERKFIIADAPGHEQYTRNMITAASNSDAAVLLIDASRSIGKDGVVKLLAQTKRHTAILQLLNCKHIIIAINKMDLLDYQQSHYQAIVEAYGALAKSRNMHNTLHFLPISALHGDNIIRNSDSMPWYQEPPLLTILENLPNDNDAIEHQAQALYFPVQMVVRQDGSQADDFRGYQGKIENGSAQIGQQVRILPYGQAAKITQIYSVNGPVDKLEGGKVATLTLDKDLDISRGNYIVAADSAHQNTNLISASICWLDSTPLHKQRKYLLKHATRVVTAKIRTIDHILDINTLSQQNDTQANLHMNDIGHISLVLQQPIVAQTYQNNRLSGAFILIDEVTNKTVAAGMIDSIAAE